MQLRNDTKGVRLTLFLGPLLLIAIQPRIALALQQRAMAVDYGASPKDIQRIFDFAPAGSLILTGTDINSVPDPQFNLDDYYRLKAYHDFGYIVLGYVSTHDGSEMPEAGVCRTLECTHTYLNQWASLYGTEIVDGIMFDEGGGLAEHPERDWFYRDIYVYAHNLGFHTIFLNVAAPLQESQQYLIDDMRVADIIQLYESPCDQYLTRYEFPHWPTWWADVPPERKSELPSECSYDQMRDAVAKSKLYGIGWIYAYDGSADAYDHLPPPGFWDDEVQMILDESAPRSVAELRQYFYGDTIFRNIWSIQQVSASATVSGSSLNLRPNLDTGGAQARVTTLSAWDLTNSSVSVRMRQVVNNGNVNNKFAILRGPYDYENALYWWYENQRLYLKYYAAGIEYPIDSLPYSSTDHAWLRIRESLGVVYWESSPNGLDWVIRGSVRIGDLFPLTSIYVALDAQTWADGSADPGQARYSNLNTGP